MSIKIKIKLKLINILFNNKKTMINYLDEYEDQAIDILLKMEIVVVIWFTLEFSGR